MNQSFYTIDPDEIDIENRQIQLKEVDNDLVIFSHNPNYLFFDRKSFKKVDFIRENSDETSPKSCLYVVDKKSVAEGINIVNVEYFNQSTLIATKMTGYSSVPAGEQHLRLNLMTNELELQHAYYEFKRPYWNVGNYVLKYVAPDEISIEHGSTHDLYIHISQFHPNVIGKQY